VFQLFTSEVANGETNKVWRSATVAGVTPAVNTDYTFAFVFDLSNKVYTAALVGNAATNHLLVGGVEVVPFACLGEATPVRSIDFVGAGTVTSIYGSYEDAQLELAFVDGQVVGEVTLTQAQAAWLNGQRVGETNYLNLATKVASMAANAFNDAYLLNLDVMNDSETPYTFEVTGITVGAETVTVSVKLTRECKLGQTINGTLKLKGTANLGGTFETLGSVDVTNEKFSSGEGAARDEATCTFQKGEGDEKFFKPVIE